jgi:hypothetical protein
LLDLFVWSSLVDVYNIFSGVDTITSRYSSSRNWLQGLDCVDGTESSLDECLRAYPNLNTWWDKTCDPFMAAGLQCVVSMTTTSAVPELTTLAVIPGSMKS